MSEETELRTIAGYLKRIARALEIANGHVPEEDIPKKPGEAAVFYNDR